MRFHNALQDVLSSPAKLAVLLYLLGHPDSRKTGREIAQEAGLSAMGANRALHDLEWSGLVHWRSVGNAQVWELKKTHFLAKELAHLTTVDQRAQEEMKAILLRHLPLKKIEKVYLFGSRARGDEKRASDIDVLIVMKREKDRREIEDKAGDAMLDTLAAFTDSLNTLHYTKKDFDSNRTPLFEEVRKTGQLLYKSDVQKS